MTLWLDGFSIDEHFNRPFDSETTITVDTNTTDERVRIQIKYDSNITLDAFELDDISRYLNAIGDGDPELELDSQNDQLTITIIADEDVYRNDGF